MQRTRYKLLSLLCLSFGCILAYIVGTFVAPPTHTYTPSELDQSQTVVKGLNIDPGDLSLGEVWETPAYRHKLTLINLTSKPIRIKDFVTSCDCTEIVPPSITIPADGSASVVAVLNLTHRLPYQVGLESHDISVRIDPVCENDYAPRPGWQVKGRVRSRVSLDTTLLAFGSMCHFGCTVSRDIHATVFMPAREILVRAEPALAVVKIEAVDGVDGIGRRVRIKVTPNKDIPVGPFEFDLSIAAVGLNGKHYPCATVPVRGEMQPSVRIEPSILLFGEQKLGAVVHDDITVSLPNHNWNILSYRSADDQMVITKQFSKDSPTDIIFSSIKASRSPWERPGRHHVSN